MRFQGRGQGRPRDTATSVWWGKRGCELVCRRKLAEAGRRHRRWRGLVSQPPPTAAGPPDVTGSTCKLDRRSRVSDTPCIETKTRDSSRLETRRKALGARCEARGARREARGARREAQHHGHGELSARSTGEAQHHGHATPALPLLPLPALPTPAASHQPQPALFNSHSRRRRHPYPSS